MPIISDTHIINFLKQLNKRLRILSLNWNRLFFGAFHPDISKTYDILGLYKGENTRGDSMLKAAVTMMKQKKYIIASIIFFGIFLAIFFILDYLNGGYPKMYRDYGVYLVIINIAMNLIMAGTSAFMMSLSTVYQKVSGREGKGTIFSHFAIFFGMMTYGCTSCVVAFFATIGITLSVAILPLAGLPYKVVAFVLVIIGALWLVLEVHRGKCKLPKRAQNISSDDTP